MGSADVSVALGRCLCADDMPTMDQLHALMDQTSDTDDDAKDKLSQLMDWWGNITKRSKAKRLHLSAKDYDQLLAR